MLNVTFIHSDDLANIDYHLCTYQIMRTMGNFKANAASSCIKQTIKMRVYGGCEVVLVSNEVGGCLIHFKLAGLYGLTNVAVK